MFPRFEYESYYKFLVSLGVIFLGAAIAFPIVVVAQTSDLGSAESQSGSFTDVAAIVVERRQALAARLLMVVPYGSIFLALCGCAMVVIGLVRWRRRQVVHDEMEDTSLLKVRAEVRKMDEAEVVASLEDEASSQDRQPASIDRAGGQQAATQIDFVERRREFLRRLARVQKVVVQGLAAASRDEFDAEVGIAIDMGPITERVDMLLRARSQAPDVLVEIKLGLAVKSLRNRIREAGVQLYRARRLYQEVATRPALGIAILAVGDEVEHWERLEQVAAEAQEEYRLLGYGTVIEFVKESELAAKGSANWGKLLERAIAAAGEGGW